MTEIRDAGSIKYNNAAQAGAAPKKAPEAEAQNPADKVTLTKEKSFGEKLVAFPGKVIKGVAGAVVATATTPLHILPGAVKGLHEGTAARKGRGREWPFHFTMFAQNIAIGASVGMMMGGPISAALGGLPPERLHNAEQAAAAARAALDDALATSREPWKKLYRR